MTSISIKLDRAHVRALQHLVESLDLELIQRCARSDQETYDMVFCLETMKEALKVALDEDSASA